MKAFQLLLIILFGTLAIYTGAVVMEYGWGLFPIFFGDLLAINWSGQFNLDFMSFLLLSALWLAWRHHFSISGLILSALTLVGGMSILAPYLLIISLKTKGDIKELLLGKARTSGS